MPERRNRPGGAAEVLQYQLGRSVATAGYSSGSGGQTARGIPVDVSAWVADSILYRGAPSLGASHYADIVHGFGLLTVIAVGFLDADGHVTNGQFFQDQMPTPSNPYGSLRVWIDPVPAGTITVFVQAFA